LTLEQPQSVQEDHALNHTQTERHKSVLQNLDIYFGFTSKELLEKLVNPLEALRKLIVVCNAVEAFLEGFVNASMNFIAEAKAIGGAEAEAKPKEESNQEEQKKKKKTKFDRTYPIPTTLPPLSNI